MLQCDYCNQAFHSHCVGIGDVPTGQFFCEKCMDEVVKMNEESDRPIDPSIDLDMLEQLNRPHENLEH